MYPYKLHTFLHLEDSDYEYRIQFASWSLQIIKIDEIFLNRVIYSDECVLWED